MGILAGLGGLATALGLGYEGYAKDQATRVEQARQRQKDMQDAAALKLQMDKYNIDKADKEAATKLKQRQLAADHVSFLQLQKEHPELVAGEQEVEGGDYTARLQAARKEAQTNKTTESQTRAFLTQLGQNFPDDAQVQKIVKAGYQPGMTMDQLKELGSSAQGRWTTTHAYHPAPAEKFDWFTDKQADNAQVYISPAQAASNPQRYGPKLTTGGGGGGASISPTAAAAMYDDLDSLNRDMKQFETDHPDIGMISAALAAGAHQKTTGLQSTLEKGVYNWALGQKDPDYQSYLQMKTRAGNIISQLNSKRGSEYQGAIDTEISSQNPGDAAQAVASQQRVRDDVLAGRPPDPPGYRRRTSPLAVPPGGTATPTFQNSLIPRATTTTQAVPGGTTDFSKMTDRQLWDAKARTPQGLKWLTDNKIPRPPGP